jgi:hypothetical protein
MYKKKNPPINQTKKTIMKIKRQKDRTKTRKVN